MQKAPKCEYVCACVCSDSSFDITEATEDKVHVGPPRDRGENLFKCSGILYFNFVCPWGRGLLAGILPQIWPGSAGLLAGL